MTCQKISNYFIKLNSKAETKNGTVNKENDVQNSSNNETIQQNLNKSIRKSKDHQKNLKENQNVDETNQKGNKTNQNIDNLHPKATPDKQPSQFNKSNTQKQDDFEVMAIYREVKKGDKINNLEMFDEFTVEPISIAKESIITEEDKEKANKSSVQENEVSKVKKSNLEVEVLTKINKNNSKIDKNEAVLKKKPKIGPKSWKEKQNKDINHVKVNKEHVGAKCEESERKTQNTKRISQDVTESTNLTTFLTPKNPVCSPKSAKLLKTAITSKTKKINQSFSIFTQKRPKLSIVASETVTKETQNTPKTPKSTVNLSKSLNIPSNTRQTLEETPKSSLNNSKALLLCQTQRTAAFLRKSSTKHQISQESPEPHRLSYNFTSILQQDLKKYKIHPKDLKIDECQLVLEDVMKREVKDGMILEAINNNIKHERDLICESNLPPKVIKRRGRKKKIKVEQDLMEVKVETEIKIKSENSIKKEKVSALEADIKEEKSESTSYDGDTIKSLDKSDEKSIDVDEILSKIKENHGLLNNNSKSVKDWTLNSPVPIEKCKKSAKRSLNRESIDSSIKSTKNSSKKRKVVDLNSTIEDPSQKTTKKLKESSKSHTFKMNIQNYFTKIDKKVDNNIKSQSTAQTSLDNSIKHKEMENNDSESQNKFQESCSKVENWLKTQNLIGTSVENGSEPEKLGESRSNLESELKC